MADAALNAERFLSRLKRLHAQWTKGKSQGTTVPFFRLFSCIPLDVQVFCAFISFYLLPCLSVILLSYSYSSMFVLVFEAAMPILKTVLLAVFAPFDSPRRLFRSAHRSSKSALDALRVCPSRSIFACCALPRSGSYATVHLKIFEPMIPFVGHEQEQRHMGHSQFEHDNMKYDEMLVLLMRLSRTHHTKLLSLIY